jgi:WD40 repeat protein
MAKLKRSLRSPASERGKSTEYDAFLSYAHHDRQVTTAIQKGLHQIGRRVGQLRALRVFRDDTNLTASPDLWGKITEALDRSGYMIVVLSPQSAASHWVNEEIRYWLQHRGHEHLMLVLAEGHLQWDATRGRFDPTQSDAAPPVLTEPGSLRSEPLYIDVSADKPWDLGSLAFRDKVTALAAPVHGKAKDELAGDDLRERRRFRRLRAAAITGLALLTVVAIVAAGVAVAQRQEAVRRLHDAVTAKLNAEGTAMLGGLTPGGDARALQELLAANAIESNGVPVLNAQIARFTTQKIIGTDSAAVGLAFSPDGHRVATSQSDGTVRQWDSATGKQIGSPFKGHTQVATDVAYTPDGRTIAATGADGTMRLWRVDTGAALDPKPQHVDDPETIAVSPDGTVLVTGGAEDKVQLWDAHSGQLLKTAQVPDHPTGLIRDVAFDRSGNWFAVGFDGGIAIFDTRTFTPRTPMIEVAAAYGATSASIFQIAISPDGHTIAVGSDNLQLINTDTGAQVRAIQLGASRGGSFATSVAFSPDGTRVATGRIDGAVQLWDTGTGGQIGPTLTGHTGKVNSIAFSPDGRQLATTSLDGTLRLWSATVGQPMTGPSPQLVHVAFRPDGHRVAASSEAAIEQWDVSSGQALPALMPSGANFEAFGFVNGGRMVTADYDGRVQVWNAATGQPVQPPVHLDTQTSYHHYAFSGDGRTVAMADADRDNVQLWSVASGQAVGHPMSANNPKDGIYDVALSPDGHHLAVGYDDGLRLWNTETSQLEGAIITRTGLLDPVSAVAFSRDGATLAAARGNGTIELWDPSTRKQLPHSPLPRHTGWALGVDFGPGHQLVSGGTDATMRLWDTATGRPTAAPLSRSDTVTDAAISPDGRLVASTTLDGNMLLSPAVADPSQLCDKLSANMSHQQWRDWVSPGIGYIKVCPGLPVPD